MPLVERLELLIKTIGAAGAARDLNQIGDASGKLGGAAAATGGKLDKLASGLGVSTAALKGGLVTAATTAATAVVAFGVKSVQAFSDLGQEVLAFQRASGATAEQSSLLVAAFDDMNIASSTGSKAIFQLGKRLETSTSQLAAYGIVAARDSRGNTDLAETLLDVADTYQRIKDPAERAALLTAAFGRQGQELIPILEGGREAIEGMFQGARDTGQVLSSEDVATAEEYRLALDQLSDSVGQFSIEIGTLLVPVLTEAADTLSGLIEAAKGVRDFAGDVGDFVGGVKEAGGGFEILGVSVGDVAKTLGRVQLATFTGGLSEGVMWLNRMGDSADDTSTDLEGFGDAVLGSFIGDIPSQAAGVLLDALEGYREGLDDLLDVTLASTSAQRGLEEAGRSLAAAQRSEADAQKDLNDLLKEGRFDLEAIRDAEVSLAAAKRSTRSAMRDQAKAQREYDAALANATDLNGLDSAQDTLAEAGDRLADANDGVADALEREADAGRALREAQAGDPDWQNKIADARQRVRDATQGVADAEYNLGQRSYENVKAHDAEKLALSGKADELARIRGELERIIALHPETLAFLGPTLAGLPPAPAALPTSGHPFFGGPTGTQASTTNNVTVNVAAPVADPVLISKEITWALIP